MRVLSFVLRENVVFLFVLFVSMWLYNDGSISACNFSKKFECKTNTKVGVTSKKSIDNEVNNKSMKLISLVDTNFFSYVSSVSINRTSDWKEKKEQITVSDVASTRNVKIYWAEFAYKQEFTNGTELSREIKLGIVFGEKEKLVWFGQIGFCPQEQFIYFKDELILFNPAAVSLEAVEFDRGLVENSKMTEIKDQTSEVLDKFVNVNFPYKHELTYRGMRCRFYDYFDNPNFTIGRGAREIKKLSVEKGLVRLDIGLRAGTQMSYVPDGTLWFDLKKGTLERVEDRTEYPPRLANERVIRESE